MDRLSEVLAAPGSVILPGHGPALPDPLAQIERRRKARLRRVGQVVDAMASGIHDPEDLVDHLYPDLHPDLRHAARISVEAVLVHVQTDPVPS
jgi:hypothetical protein